jgi:hypothetical protein
MIVNPLFNHSGCGIIDSMSKQIPAEVRNYMSQIGRIKTPAKVAASRRNASVAAQARRKDPASLPCTCGQCPDNPKTTCPRGRLLRQRERLMRAAMEDEQDLETARRISQNSKPEEWRTLDEARRAIRG